MKFLKQSGLFVGTHIVLCVLVILSGVVSATKSDVVLFIVQFLCAAIIAISAAWVSS